MTSFPASGKTSSRLPDEALRILIAVEERRLFRNKHGRFEIDREERPDRKTRESLRRRGLIVSVYGNDGYRITATGKAELDHGLLVRREEQA